MKTSKKDALEKAKAIKAAELSACYSYVERYEEEYGQPPIDYALIKPANPHLANK